jgi:predicted transcriptional regulator of viral defense system
MRQSVEIAVKNKIIQRGRGWCFTVMDFDDLGSGDSIRHALSKLEREKLIRRLSQGIYDYPQEHKDLGVVPPNLNEVAKAIAEKNGVRIQPSGAHAANLAGLSEQVPGRIVFLTDGPARKVKIGKQEIVFKKTTSKVMHSAGTREGLIIQGFKNLGRNQIDDVIRARARKFLVPSSPEDLRKNMKFAPAWIKKLVFEIMEIK